MPSNLPKPQQIATSRSKKRTFLRSDVRHVPKNRQVGRRLVDPLGPNTRLCPYFVSMTHGQKKACWWFIHPKLLKYETYRTEVLKCVSSVTQNQRVEWSKVLFGAVEVFPVGSKPPAAVGEPTSKGKGHDLSVAALLSTRELSQKQGSAGGPMQSSPKLAERFGFDPVRRNVIPMHRLNCLSGAHRALVSHLVCLNICLHGRTWLPSVML